MKHRKKTFDEILTLITVVSSGKSDMGVPNLTEIKSDVYCKELSIGLNAELQARQLGIKWDKKFAIHSFEYKNQQIVEFQGSRYQVDRVYGTDLDETELTCTFVKEVV